MTRDRDTETPPDFAHAVGTLGPALLTMLHAFESVSRRLHPPQMAELRGELGPVVARLTQAHDALRRCDPPADLGAFAEQLSLGAQEAEHAGRLFLGEERTGPGGPMDILEAMRAHARAQAALFPLRSTLPPLDAWFIEPGFEERLSGLAEAASRGEAVGLFNASNDRDRRGGFTLFVPEDYSNARAWPLVVALHGGLGHGGEFVWTWLREARSRGWLLLAPTSRDTTWSLQSPDLDGRSLDGMLEYVIGRWRVDPARLLLTGLSDGGTFALLHGLSEDSPFTHLAPVSGVLHPLNFANGNLARAKGRRIRLVHGARDWMFPVETAREAARALGEAGAEIDYDEVEGLSHAWPRERGGQILAWAAGNDDPVRVNAPGTTRDGSTPRAGDGD